MPTEKKQTTVAEVTEELAHSNLVVLADYRGLNMKDMTTMRRNLQKAGVEFHVVKNTLLLLAMRGANVSGLDPYMEGPTAVAFAHEDPVAGAKALQEQLAAFPTVHVKAGWMEGQVLQAGRIKELATLPPRSVLLGQVVGTIQSPVANIASILNTIAQQLIYVLKTHGEQGGAAEGEAAPAAEAA